MCFHLDVLLREGLAHFSKTMLSCMLYLFKQHSPGAAQACLQSRTVTNRKHLIHHETTNLVKTQDCWTARILHQTRTGQDASPKTGLLSSEVYRWLLTKDTSHLYLQCFGFVNEILEIFKSLHSFIFNFTSQRFHYRGVVPTDDNTRWFLIVEIQFRGTNRKQVIVNRMFLIHLVPLTSL